MRHTSNRADSVVRSGAMSLGLRSTARVTLIAAVALTALVEGLWLTRPAAAQLSANAKSLTVTTTNSVATFSGPDLTGLVNSLTGESYLIHPSAGELAGVNTIAFTGQTLQASNWTIGSEAGTGHPMATITCQDATRTLILRVKVDPVSQEIVLRLSASTTVAGLRDASWSIAGLNLDTGRLILPSDTGIVLDRAHPNLGPWTPLYPNNWHAQMAVYEAAHGSFVFYSTDTQANFKQLRTSTRGSSSIDVTVATEAVAPWPSATAVPTIEWRLKSFSGDWRAAAAVYRDWLFSNRPPLSNAAHPWVSDIATVVTLPSDTALLAPLAAVLIPSKTLLYLVDWRVDPFDVDYPDYTPRAGMASFISAAHALGFKVMLHLDAIGVSPGNPNYPAMQPYQVRTSESLALLGWQWDLSPSLPGRFAYINPAATAFRNLLITSITAGISGLNADALHLDISNAAINDGNGLVGGLNTAQGMAQLHQDIVNAFPALAIGGEGETDVTYRYHSFTQSWWLPGGPTEGHPIASFLFSPQVMFYGHLGQSIARSAPFRDWLLQLQRRAITPQVRVWGLGDLDPADPDNARLFGLLQSWQTHAFKPAWTADWSGALVRYEGLGGAMAALTDSGTMTTLTATGGTLFQIAHDVSEISTTASARNWPAFDAARIVGFDPAKRYFIDPIARPAITHVTSLPSGYRLGDGTLVGAGFAHVEVLPPTASLFDFDKGLFLARVGVTYQGSEWPLAYGAVVARQSLTAGGVTRSGYFIHPPWQGQQGGETFAEFPVSVPVAASLRFSVGVADNANCTDGVTLRVTVAGTEIWRQHVLRTGWQDATLNLSSYGGTTVPIRLISHPGPANDSGCDWSLWSGLTMLTVPDGAPISIPLALSSGSIVSGFDGSGTYMSTGALSGMVNGFTVPGQFTLFTQDGVPVANGTNLAALSFQTWIWGHGDLARLGAVQFAGAVGPFGIGGVTKNPAIYAGPPEHGATRFSWLVRLPSTTNLRLGFSAGLADGAFTQDGVEFVVRVNGTPYWRFTKLSIGWTSGSLDLSRWKGQSVLIDLATDALETVNFDHAVWADLVLSTSSTTCTYGVPAGAPIGPAGGTFTFNVTATATCPWSVVSSAPSWLTPVNGSGSSNGSVTYTVGPNTGPPRTAMFTVAGQTFTVTQGGALPTMTFDKTSLQFAGVPSNLLGLPVLVTTSAQAVRLTQVGAGTVTWTATVSHPWLTVTPSSGNGSATLSVAMASQTVPPYSAGMGTITFAFSGATNSTSLISVTLTLPPGPLATLGVIDTPLENSTGVTGAVPFTGWALDSIEVVGVTLCRAAVSGETASVDGRCGGAAQIYVGDATFIDGARPDVLAAHPTHPRSSRAGWGFMVLTNMLPNQGNGTYVFYAYAFGRPYEALRLGGLPRVTLLGTRTMTCANASATKPFGAIDTPTQGGTASGPSFVNFGWALTPTPKLIPLNGSTITVLVDGASIGTADYNHERPDIETLFPGFQNTAGTNGAIGFRVIDTTALTNGLHTISWTVVDNQGAIEGIGSRFFTVSNGAGCGHGGSCDDHAGDRDRDSTRAPRRQC